MIKEFRSYIENTLKISSASKVIVAVSGGIDSKVLLHLANQAFDKIVIAHCNFQLRGSESDDDEKFVRDIASELDIPIYLEKFNTTKYAVEHKISIQVAARELRLKWFEDLRTELNFDYIALGHNKNDVTETFLQNLLRGSGIKGLTSIPPKTNKIIRPILFASREEITDYSRLNNIRYRVDSSNKTLKYTRNKIRNTILPLFLEINNNYEDHIHQAIDYLSDVKLILLEKIEEHKTQIFADNSPNKINIIELQKIPYHSTLLFFLLGNFGFNSSTIQDIVKVLNDESGKIFYSDSHRLLKDRNLLIIKPKIEENDFKIEINEDTAFISSPLSIEIKKLNRTELFNIPTIQREAALDLEKISFPLTIRKWKDGDKFIPLGMNNFKKLSDFFIDNKIPIFDKEEIYILCDKDDTIIWIINNRIDDRFKVTRNTKFIYHLEIQL